MQRFDPYLQLSQGQYHFDTVIAVRRPGHNQIFFHDVEQWRFTDLVVLTATG